MKTYRVKSGETLGMIADKFYGDFKQWPYLAAANQLANPGHLNTGQILVIPPLVSYASVERTIQGNFADSPPAAIRTLERLSQLPVRTYAPLGAVDYRSVGWPQPDDEPIPEIEVTAQRLPVIDVTTDPSGIETVNVSGRRDRWPLYAVLGLIGLLALTNR